MNAEQLLERLDFERRVIKRHLQHLPALASTYDAKPVDWHREGLRVGLTLQLTALDRVIEEASKR